MWTIIKPHTVTSSILSSCPCDPFGEDRWHTGSMYELDRPCPHSSAAYSHSVPIRRGTEMVKKWLIRTGVMEGGGVRYSKRGFDGRCRDIEVETRTQRQKLMVGIYCGIC